MDLLNLPAYPSAVQCWPGPIDTSGLNNFFCGMAMGKDQVKKAIITSVPIGRMGAPDEVASAVFLFLASDDSSLVAGTDLFFD